MSRACFKISLLLVVLVCGLMPLTAYGAFEFGDPTAQIEATVEVADQENFMHKVTFDAGAYGQIDGSKTLTLTAWSGETIDSLPVVTLNAQGLGENKVFAQWQTDDTIAFTTDTPITASLTVYAVYQ